ncbi:phosphatase PAP2 family protein [Streptomyces qinglanensis]|uniref:Membrane-associated phospholipid phosphatase n=1 Tax=Streptomyces qinglanensis TaxID=943816 RepID=A0A1H9PL24_9ACTN|nr:phosphatase PAP2 family protein [Streptomyces qinglanensis]SER48790.1 Membrane-associated phospholipid phosphatase [Streptomyces qinglanensis]
MSGQFSLESTGTPEPSRHVDPARAPEPTRAPEPPGALDPTGVLAPTGPPEPSEVLEPPEVPEPPDAVSPGGPPAHEPLAPKGLLKRLAPVQVPLPAGSATRRGGSREPSRRQPVRFLPWSAALLASLLLFAATSFLVLRADAGFLDRPVLNALVQHRYAAALHGPMTYLTHAAEGPLVITAVLLALWLSWRDASWRPLVLVGGAAALAVAAATAAKHAAYRARPPAELWEVQESGFGFPSRHTVIATAVLLALAWVLAERLGGRAARAALWTGAAVLSLLAGICRVGLGVHWPTDVLAGLALGTAVPLLVVGAYALCETRRFPPPSH